MNSLPRIAHTASAYYRLIGTDNRGRTRLDARGTSGHCLSRELSSSNRELRVVN